MLVKSNAYRILVNISARRLYLYQGDSLKGEYHIGVGKESTPTPIGDFLITEKETDPASANFGTRNLHLSNTSSCIHGTDEPSSIGGSVSGG
jgi:lipoprotein-anchoring transpeptidase ErfK/SrfK